MANLAHAAALRTTIAQAVADAMNVGTTNPNGQMVLMTSGDVEVATLDLSNPAASSVAAGVMTYGAITSDTNATGGVIAKMKVVNRDGATVITGDVSVTGGGGDVELSSLTIGAGDTVSVSAASYTAAV